MGGKRPPQRGGPQATRWLRVLVVAALPTCREGSMSIEVRVGSEADLDTLVHLNEPVQSLHAALYPNDFRQEADPAAVKAFFGARLADSRNAVGIAVAGGTPVGYIFFEIQTRLGTAFTA